VHVHGPLAHDAVASWLAGHDVLAFPSTWMENSPFVLREAGAAGIRILASDVPGARVVAPQARFVPPGDVGAWAAALSAERAAGGRRVAPARFADMASHAAEVLARYVALLA
jgi:glycosyltransferase involved in cell wall biosynthesis